MSGTKAKLFLLLAAVAAALVLWLISRGHTRHGFTIKRQSQDSVRISWGTPSGAHIDPQHTLSFLFQRLLEYPEELDSLELPKQADVWMFEINPERMGSATHASYVNPRNDDAINKMFAMIALGKRGQSVADEYTRLVDDSYIYLGWAAMDDEQFDQLTRALKDRGSVDMSADLPVESGTLPKLNHLIASRANPEERTNPAGDEPVAHVPFVFERLDRRQGHPCDVMHVLYLDGTIEAVPVGTKFPATQRVIDYFSSH